MAINEIQQFKNKSVHIIGMARSGLASAEVLISLGARITIHDKKNIDDLCEQIDICHRLGIEIKVGSDAYQNIVSADYLVISPGVPLTCEAVLKAEELGIPVLPEIELAYRISKAPIIAITGTNGKTTTTALIGAMLKSSYKKVFIAGNIVAGNLRLPLVNAAAIANEDDIIVAEISSFQLEKTSSFKPKISVFLNVSNDHLDRHPDLETYASMKARLFEYQDESDYAILNADDPIVAETGSHINSKSIYFSKNEIAEGFFIRGKDIIYKTNGCENIICNMASMKLRGIHNMENVLAASAAVTMIDIDPKQIQSALDDFSPLEHRLEPVSVINGVEFINNSMCTNVAASVSSLEAIGKPAIVIAGGKDKGSDYTDLGKAFCKYAKFVVLIGADSELIFQASVKAGFTEIDKADSLYDAVKIALSHATSGDAIVLSPGCASFDMFKNFEDRGNRFKEIIYDLAESANG